MSIERHHTYAADAARRLLAEEGLPVPDLAELERDFQRTLAILKEHAPHHAQHRGLAGVIAMLRQLGHWCD